MPSTERYWAILTIQQILLDNGWQIIISTNHRCHLWMYWCNFTPYISKKTHKKRGAVLCWLKGYAIRWKKLIEQTEAGETYWHTFNVTSWPVCETRWFFFHGIAEGIWSPSYSPILSKHKTPTPTTAYFYPDKHPEVSSVDGDVGRTANNQTWFQIREGAATTAHPSAANCDVAVTSYSLVDKWVSLRRLFFLFDTSSIPVTAEIISANLRFYLVDKANQTYVESEYCVVPSWPLVNTNLALGDYQRIGELVCSDIKTYSGFSIGTYNTFFLNAAGCAHIEKGGITKFGIREYNHDVTGDEPYWQASKANYLKISCADGPALWKPRLEVVYQS